MGRIISPKKSELAHLKTPLEKGEKLVLDLFEQSLSDDWEIYVQPHLNGCRPDFVLINPNVGLAVFEVKDWDLDLMEYSVKNDPNGHPKLTAKKNGKSFFLSSPLKQVQRYKREIHQVYCPRLDARAGFATITAGVIFPFADDDRLKDLFEPLRSLHNQFPQYDPISGSNSVQSGDIRRIFPESQRNSSMYMSEVQADDLRSWLVEPDYSAEQRQPLELDANQRELIQSRTESGYRRIRGPAGSGKSLVLAARAARLAEEGKDVLVISFNITLLHYLRDLCSRCPEGRPNRITWLNFHHWCKRVVEDLDQTEAYKNLWKNLFEKETPENAETNLILSEEIPQLIINVLQSDGSKDTPTFDVILVDEGQDFDPSWWNALRHVCRDGGELILAADATQDVYGTAKKWTDDAMKGAGFSGPWSELSVSYRLPPAILELAAKFADTVLPPDNRSSPQPIPKQTELELSPCDLRWVQTAREFSAEACLEELFDIIRRDDEGTRSIPDLTLLTDNVEDGLKIVEKLKKKGINTVHTFSSETSTGTNKFGEDRRKKLGFWKGDARVKLTTLHSFKGWEGRLIVLNITHAQTPKDFALIYTGLTRLKKHPIGSCLTVVCSEIKLRGFGKIWPDFIQRN